MEIILPILMGTVSGLLVYGLIGFLFTRKTEIGKKFLLKSLIFGFLFIVVIIWNLYYFKK